MWKEFTRNNLKVFVSTKLGFNSCDHGSLKYIKSIEDE